MMKWVIGSVWLCLLLFAGQLSAQKNSVDPLLSKTPPSTVFRALLRPEQIPGPEYFIVPEKIKENLQAENEAERENILRILNSLAIPYFQESITGLGEIEEYLARWDPQYRESFFKAYQMTSMNLGTSHWEAFLDDFDLRLQNNIDLSEVQKILAISTVSVLGLQVILSSADPINRMFSLDFVKYFLSHPEKSLYWLKLNIEFPYLSLQGATFSESVLQDNALPLLVRLMRSSTEEVKSFFDHVDRQPAFQNFAEEKQWLLTVIEQKVMPADQELSVKTLRRLAYLLALDHVIQLKAEPSQSLLWTVSDMEDLAQIFTRVNRSRLEPKPLGKLRESEIELVAEGSTAVDRIQFIQDQKDHQFSYGLQEINPWSFLGATAGFLLVRRALTATQAVRTNFLRTRAHVLQHLMNNAPPGLQGLNPSQFEAKINESLSQKTSRLSRSNSLPSDSNPAFKEGFRYLRQLDANIESIQKRISKRFSPEVWEQMQRRVNQVQTLGSLYQAKLSQNLAPQLETLVNTSLNLRQAESIMKNAAAGICSLQVTMMGFHELQKKYISKIIRQSKVLYQDQLNEQMVELAKNKQYVQLFRARLSYYNSFWTPRFSKKLKSSFEMQGRRYPWSRFQNVSGDYRLLPPGSSLTSAVPPFYVRATKGYVFPLGLMGWAFMDAYRAFRLGDLDQKWKEAQEEKNQYVEDELGGDFSGIQRSRQTRLEGPQVEGLRDDLESAFRELNLNRHLKQQDLLAYHLLIPQMDQTHFYRGFLYHVYVLVVRKPKGGGLVENLENVQNGILIRLELKKSQSINFELSEEMGIEKEEELLPESASWVVEDAVLLDPRTDRRRKQIAVALDVLHNESVRFDPSRIMDLFGEDYVFENFWTGKNLGLIP